MLKKSTDGFESLIALIGQYGGYNPPADISYRMAVIINRMGGWSEVCSWRNRDLDRKLPLFKVIFREVTDLLRNPEVPSLHSVALKGIHSSQVISP